MIGDVVIAERAVSWSKVGSHISSVVRTFISHGFSIVPNSVIYVGHLAEHNYKLLTASRVVAYIDVPRIVDNFRNVYRLIRHKTILIANSRYTAELVETYYGVNINDIVPHGVDVSVFSPELAGNRRISDVMFFGDAYREGIDRWHMFLVRKSSGTLHVCHSSSSGAEVVVKFNNVVPDYVIALLYSSARTLLVLSRHEGFCIPVIEASCVGTIPVVPNVKPFTEHYIPFKVTFEAYLDVNRLYKNPDGVYPIVEFDIESAVRAVELACRHVNPSISDVRYVCERYDYRKLYTKIVEYILKR